MIYNYYYSNTVVFLFILDYLFCSFFQLFFLNLDILLLLLSFCPVRTEKLLSFNVHIKKNVKVCISNVCFNFFLYLYSKSKNYLFRDNFLLQKKSKTCQIINLIRHVFMLSNILRQLGNDSLNYMTPRIVVFYIIN